VGGDLENMPNGDPHHMENRLETATSKIHNSEEISNKDKELLQQFQEHLNTQDLSTSRITRHLQCLKILAEYSEEPLLIDNRKQVNRLVAGINKNKIKDKELSDSTKAEYRKSLIKYVTDFLESMKFDIDKLDEEMNGDELMKNITSTVPSKRPDPDRLPTPNTVRKLVKNTSNTRDKAFIMSLWSTGGRIGELLGLKWKDLKFKQRNGERIAQVKFRDTKTNDSRKVPLRAGVVTLEKWKDESFESSNPESYIFHNFDNGNQLTYNSAYKIIKRSRKKSEIEENIKTNPHSFRKARATFLASQGMNQANLCDYMGWVQGSDQAAVYIGLAESDKENSIMELAGLEVPEDQQQRDLLPVRCHVCGELNSFERENCKSCSEILTTSEMFEQVKIEEATDELVYNVAMNEGGFSEDELREKAEELVKEKYQ
jgi:integrase